MFERAHTIAAVALTASVPLGPLGMWIYATAASPDRAAQQRRAEQLVAAAAPPAGARTSFNQALTIRAWDGEGLVPVRTWRFTYVVRLARRVTPAVVVAHYRRELSGWTKSVERSSCRMLSLPRHCAARDVSFHRDGWSFRLDLGEYLARDGQTLTTYGISVSQ